MNGWICYDQLPRGYHIRERGRGMDGKREGGERGGREIERAYRRSGLDKEREERERKREEERGYRGRDGKRESGG